MANSRLLDLAGKRFGRLTVTERAPNPRDRQVLWRCRCDCGGVTVVRSHLLRGGLADNCGCLKSGRISARKTTHGHAGGGPDHRRSPEYRSWRAMLNRCTNPRADNYGYYGGAGVTVCPEWAASFERFLADVGPMPAGGRSTVDRIDNARGYEPGNVRWADHSTQTGNRRNSRKVTHDGLTLHVAEWSRRTGVPAGTIIRRLNRGASSQEALAPPGR